MLGNDRPDKSGPLIVLNRMPFGLSVTQGEGTETFASIIIITVLLMYVGLQALHPWCEKRQLSLVTLARQATFVNTQMFSFHKYPQAKHKYLLLLMECMILFGALLYFLISGNFARGWARIFPSIIGL